MRHLLGVSVKAVSAPQDPGTPGGSLASPSTELVNSWLPVGPYPDESGGWRGR